MIPYRRGLRFGSLCTILSKLSAFTFTNAEMVLPMTNVERVLPMTLASFNPGEFWIGGVNETEHKNNLTYDEFDKCVVDLSDAIIQDHDKVMSKSSYLEFLRLQSNNVINEASFNQILPELSMAYWNLVCVITEDDCNTDSTVTLQQIEDYALDDGGWLIYQLCSRIDVYLSDALEPTRSPSVVPSDAPTATASPSNWPSSSPSTKNASFTFVFQMEGTVPCYEQVLPKLMDDKIREILKCDNSGVCVDDCNVSNIITTTTEFGKYGSTLCFTSLTSRIKATKLYFIHWLLYNFSPALVSFVNV